MFLPPLSFHTFTLHFLFDLIFSSLFGQILISSPYKVYLSFLPEILGDIVPTTCNVIPDQIYFKFQNYLSPNTARPVHLGGFMIALKDKNLSPQIDFKIKTKHKNYQYSTVIGDYNNTMKTTFELNFDLN